MLSAIADIVFVERGLVKQVFLPRSPNPTIKDCNNLTSVTSQLLRPFESCGANEGLGGKGGEERFGKFGNVAIKREQRLLADYAEREQRKDCEAGLIMGIIGVIGN